MISDSKTLTILILITASYVLLFLTITRQLFKNDTNFRIGYSSKYSDALGNLPVAATFHEASIFNDSSPRYLWCAYHYGPNNQLRDFVKCAILAARYKFTLVLSPIFPHHFDRIRDPQWFEQIYDLNMLKSMTKVITVDEFASKMTTDKKKIIMDCFAAHQRTLLRESRYVNRTILSVEKQQKVEVKFRRFLNVTHLSLAERVYKSIRNCSSVFLYLDYFSLGHFFSQPNSHTGHVFAHLIRSEAIQNMAQKVFGKIPEIAYSQTIITKNSNVIHINATNVTVTSTELVNRTATNVKMILAAAHIRRGDNNVMTVHKFIRQMLTFMNISMNFTHLYVMCPYLEPKEIDAIRRSLPVPLLTSDDIRKYLNPVTNDFIFSMIEQEIGYQASIFIGSAWSTYTTTVQLQKVYQKKGTVYLFAKSNHHTDKPILITEKNAKYYE